MGHPGMGLLALPAFGGSCDEGGGIGGAEAVVDVDYGDVGGAGVEHAEEGGGSAEAGSVAYGGGDGDDGDSDEASDDRGERAFHSGADDDGVGGGELVADCEEAVDTGYADVVEAGDPGVEELGSDRGFLGDGEVAGSGADYSYVAMSCRMDGLAEGDGPGLRVMDSSGDGFEDGEGGRFVGAGGEDVVSGGGHAGEDLGCLDGGFSGGIDDLGQANAEPAVVIDASVADVFEGK